MRGDSGVCPSGYAMFFRTPGGPIGRWGFCFGARRGAEDAEVFGMLSSRLRSFPPTSVQPERSRRPRQSGWYSFGACTSTSLSANGGWDLGRPEICRVCSPSPFLPCKGRGASEAGGGVSPVARADYLSGRDTPPSGLRPATSPARGGKCELCAERSLRSPRLCANLPREGRGTAKPQSPSLPQPQPPAAAFPASSTARYW